MYALNSPHVGKLNARYGNARCEFSWLKIFAHAYHNCNILLTLFADKIFTEIGNRTWQRGMHIYCNFNLADNIFAVWLQPQT